MNPTNMLRGAYLLRVRDGRPVEVKPIELFFDLVYVLAITQLTEFLLEELTIRGAARTLLLLLAVWWAWVDTAWFTNWFDPDTRPVRLMLIFLMFAGLIVSATLPDAFDDRGLVFAAAFTTMQVTRSLFASLTLSEQPSLRLNWERIFAWRATSGVLWIAGGMADDTARELLWLAAVLIDLIAAASGFVLPHFGRSHTTDWSIAGGHLAERCRLFIILALGESILITGANFGELPSSSGTVFAFIVAFVGSVALWWIYFDRADEAARHVIASSSDPGRLGRSAYTYFHVPMAAGIITAAAADEVTIAHPSQEATAATTALILGGPALYLLGNALFKWTLWHHVPRSRYVALGALAALIPLAIVSSNLLLSIAATLVLIGLAASDVVAHWREIEFAPSASDT